MSVTFDKNRFTIPFIKNLVFEEFFFHKVHLGENILYWEATNKPFALCFYKSQAFIDLGITISKLKYLFYFLIHAFSFTKNITFFSIGGLPYNQKTRLFESVSTFKTLQNPYIVGWLNGLLTNFPKVVNQFWLKKHKNKSEFKKEWFIKMKKGLKSLLKFPDFFIFFSIKGPYNSAFREACKFNSPIIAFLDTDSVYYNIQFPIGGNDDSLYSLKLYVILLRETIIRGLTDKLFDIMTKNFLWRFKIETIKFVTDLKNFFTKTQLNLSKSLFYENKFESFIYNDILIKKQYLICLKNKLIKNSFLDKSLFLASKNYFTIAGYGNLLLYFFFEFENLFIQHDSMMFFLAQYKNNNMFFSTYSIFRFFFFFFRYNVSFLEALLKENSAFFSHLDLKKMAKLFNLNFKVKRILKKAVEKKQINELNTNDYSIKNKVDYSDEYLDFFTITQNFLDSSIFFKKDITIKMIISSFKRQFKIKYLKSFQKSKNFLFVQKNLIKIREINNFLIMQFRIYLKKQKIILDNAKKYKKNFMQLKLFTKVINKYKLFFYDILKIRQPMFFFSNIEKITNESEFNENMLDFLKKRYTLKKKETKSYLFYVLKKIITKMKMKIHFKKEIVTIKNFLDKVKKNDVLLLETTKDALLVKKNVEKFFSTKKSNLRSIQSYTEFTFLR